MTNVTDHTHRTESIASRQEQAQWDGVFDGEMKAGAANHHLFGGPNQILAFSGVQFEKWGNVGNG